MDHNASGSSRFSFANGANAQFIESLYDAWKKDPASVDTTWQKFFEGYEFAKVGDVGGAAAPSAAAGTTGGAGGDEGLYTARVEAFINAYRRLGHLSAHLNPLGPAPGVADDMLPEAHGLGGVDPNRRFHAANLPKASQTFAEIYQLLKDTYCGKIGADFREVNDITTVVWMQEQMESCRNRPPVSAEMKRRILTMLSKAEGFEQFLGRRYIGAKRFSLEGLDAMIPLLDVVAAEAARAGAEEMSLGMAHRGRLNVLANFMGKPYELILKEFEGGEYNVNDIDGDVKYHMGYANEVPTEGGGKIRLCLSPNPSHLEAVNPVVEGFVRARQRLLKDEDRRRVIPLLMHGDAAFMGQGGVAETLNLSQLSSYETGGTIHIITNNQIGFTTDPPESRSTVYASDVAKMIRAPVLHVNADDPEAVIWCGRLAVAYRQKFGSDIVIDLIGYRRHGHNEGDEPSFTQPLMYKAIGAHPTVLKLYADAQVAANALTEAEVTAAANAMRDAMQTGYDAVHGKVVHANTGGAVNLKTQATPVPASLQRAMTYKKATRDELLKACETGVSGKTLKDVVTKLTTPPKGFTPHPKLARLLETRQKMVTGDGAVDWGLGELMAFATLSLDGHHVRVSGQDVGRGTFTSRHAVWTDVQTGQRHLSLAGLGGKNGPVEIINSPLSEQGCLAFEFGYSVADPDALVAWEAQFGDFVNGAQVLIDQFLSASEAKWKQTCGLVLLLPHGYEGQGPEHSSARPERFLQLCGNLNMQVVIPTTPAQHFHALRRQLGRDFRKPLIVMTPKSLLREPLCVSTIADFEKGRFTEIVDDPTTSGATPAARDKVERIIACSGKIYYDLYKARAENPRFANVPVVRFEQLYPFPSEQVQAILARYPRCQEVVWTQEEPQNMGGWNFVRGRLLDVLKSDQRLAYVGRKNSGTPAEGSAKAHEAEQKRILQDALQRASGSAPRAAASGMGGD